MTQNHLEYHKVWECMNDLESAFNEITVIEGLINYIEEAVVNEEQMEVVDAVHALKAYLPIFTRKYDKASKRAWNNTVGALHPETVPHIDL